MRRCAVGADLVAWIRVQKVSNLILNMNVYMADSGRFRADVKPAT